MLSVFMLANKYIIDLYPGFSNVIDYPRFVIVSALRSLHNSTYPLLIFIGLGLILSLPIGYLLAFTMRLGARAIPW